MEEGNECKAIEDLINDSGVEGEARGKANNLYGLRRKGLLKREVAAERLGLSVEEYERREDRFFSLKIRDSFSL